MWISVGDNLLRDRLREFIQNDSMIQTANQLRDVILLADYV